MAAPQKPAVLQLPIFKIQDVKIVLEKNDKIYVRLFHATDKNKQKFTMRERTGLEVEKFIDNKPLECVVEIVKAQFFDLNDKENKPPVDTLKGTFVGWETGYKFFQELVSMVDGETGDADDEDFNEDEYDALATELFEKWGECGFGQDVYRDKPMIKTDIGTFFLNEYIFEDLIDKWEESFLPNVPVCFKIEELLLHGIKIYEGEWKTKKTIEENFVIGPNDMLIRGPLQIIDPY